MSTWMQCLTRPPELNEKPNDGAGAAAVVVVEPDADEPKLNPVAPPEKRLGVDAAGRGGAERTRGGRRRGRGGPEWARGGRRRGRGGRIGLGVALRRKSRRIGPRCHRTDSRRLPQSQWRTHRRGRGCSAAVEVAPKNPGLLAAEVAAPNKLRVVPAEDAGVAPKRDGADAADEAAAMD